MRVARIADGPLSGVGTLAPAGSALHLFAAIPGVESEGIALESLHGLVPDAVASVLINRLRGLTKLGLIEARDGQRTYVLTEFGARVVDGLRGLSHQDDVRAFVALWRLAGRLRAGWNLDSRHEAYARIAVALADVRDALDGAPNTGLDEASRDLDERLARLLTLSGRTLLVFLLAFVKHSKDSDGTIVGITAASLTTKPELTDGYPESENGRQLNALRLLKLATRTKEVHGDVWAWRYWPTDSAIMLAAALNQPASVPVRAVRIKVSMLRALMSRPMALRPVSRAPELRDGINDTVAALEQAVAAENPPKAGGAGPVAKHSALVTLVGAASLTWQLSEVAGTGVADVLLVVVVVVVGAFGTALVLLARALPRSLGLLTRRPFFDRLARGSGVTARMLARRLVRLGWWLAAGSVGTVVGLSLWRWWVAPRHAH